MCSKDRLRERERDREYLYVLEIEKKYEVVKGVKI